MKRAPSFRVELYFLIERNENNMALADPKKAKVTHILKDGTVLDSLEGYTLHLDEDQKKALAKLLYFLDKRDARKRREE